MDSTRWFYQGGIGLVKPMDELAAPPTPSTANQTTGLARSSCSATRPPPPQLAERRPRPKKEQALNCPRCNSTKTKFCYYNNYSLSQPRYFCKTCRRYWTNGGTLRNVPVGGGSRNKKRSYNSSSNSTSAQNSPSPSLKISTDHYQYHSDPSLPGSFQSTTKFTEGQDLNLAFQSHSTPPFLGAISAMDLLRSKISPLESVPVTVRVPEGGDVYSSGFGLYRDWKPSGLSLNGGDHGGERVLFPFEDLKQVSEGRSETDQFASQPSSPQAGFWNASW